MPDELAIIKIGLQLVQVVHTESRYKGKFGSLFFIPFMTI